MRQHEQEPAGEAKAGGATAEATSGPSANAALLHRKILRRKAQRAALAGEADAAEEAEAHAHDAQASPPERGGEVAAHDAGDKSGDLLEIGRNAGGVRAAFGGGDDKNADVAPDAPAPSPQTRAETAPAETARKDDAAKDDAAKDDAAKDDAAKDGAAKDGAAKDKAAAVDAQITAWLAESPSGTAAVAGWLLAAQRLGFLTMSSNFYQQQLVDLHAGSPTIRVLVSLKGEVGRVPVAKDLPALTILAGLVKARAQRWVASPTGKKDPVQCGDLFRNLQDVGIPDAHRAASTDLFAGFNWTGPDGPKQVMQVLSDLPKGSYRIGLPFQGEFFPSEDYLANRQQMHVAAAGPGGTPKDITQPMLVRFTTQTYTSRWAGAPPKYPWKDAPAGAVDLVTRLRSAALRERIATLRGQGTSIGVFPDNDNHIHVTRD